MVATIIFESSRIGVARPPKLSVVMPVRNGEPFLAHQLEALANQTYRGPWELIVADNSSTDRSVQTVKSFAGRIERLVIVDASRKLGRAAACNDGATAARGTTLAFCDADDVARPGWLEACANASRRHPLVAGALDHYALGGTVAPWKARSLDEPPMMPGGRRFADGSNLVVAKAAFDAVGGFCEELLRAEDVDLSWRLELAGYELCFEPAAVIAKRGRSSYRELWRQSFAWGIGDVALGRRHGSQAASASPRALWELRRDPRLRDGRFLKALVNPRYHRSWVAAMARVWGRAYASVGIMLSPHGRGALPKWATAR
jgi:glycosyltransferase involved in cell wall biosynthesis